MFLTAEEVRQLTGYRFKSLQRRWLEEQGLPFKVSKDGRPVLLRATIFKAFKCKTGDDIGTNEPNFDAM